MLFGDSILLRAPLNNANSVEVNIYWLLTNGIGTVLSTSNTQLLHLNFTV